MDGYCCGVTTKDIPGEQVPSVNNVSFGHPIPQASIVTLKLIFLDLNSSMEVIIDVWTEDIRE